MSGLVVYHNPSCTKSRKAVGYLEEQQQQKDNKIYELEICKYKADPPSQQVLQHLAEYLGLMEKDDATRPWDVLVRPEAKNKASSWEEVWTLLEQDPALLERPFVIDWDNKKAALGRAVPAHPDLRTVETLVEEYIANKKYKTTNMKMTARVPLERTSLSSGEVFVARQPVVSLEVQATAPAIHRPHERKPELNKSKSTKSVNFDNKILTLGLARN
ncbi:unnamed protein product [Absidia cylindrospora]